MEQLTHASYPKILLAWAVIILAASTLYFSLSFVPGPHGISKLDTMDLPYRFFNSLYFSIITATTVGYGDLVPHGFAKIIVCFQSVSSFFLATIFVAKLVSHRQEMTLERVHQMTFEHVFHNTRESFFIVRKDFDALIHEVELKHELSAKSWDNLSIAYRQLQNLFEDIPQFYRDDTHLYTIDEKREVLLIDAVLRTLKRLDHLIDILEVAGIRHQTDEHAFEELHRLLTVMDSALPLWQEKSPYHHAEEFEQILMTKHHLMQRLKHKAT